MVRSRGARQCRVCKRTFPLGCLETWVCPECQDARKLEEEIDLGLAKVERSIQTMERDRGKDNPAASPWNSINNPLPAADLFYVVWGEKVPIPEVRIHRAEWGSKTFEHHDPDCDQWATLRRPRDTPEGDVKFSVFKALRLADCNQEEE